jgi:2-methylcitrate dehydratase PrpD
MKTAAIIDQIKAEPAGSATITAEDLEADPQEVQSAVLAAFTDGSRLLTTRSTETHFVVAWTNE